MPAVDAPKPGGDNEEPDKLISFTANIDCEKCGTVFDATWTTDLIDVEQMQDPPVQDFTCPNPECGHTEEYEYPGWSNYTDA